MQGNTEEYYQYIATINRIEDERTHQGLKDCEMNRRMGMCLAYWGNMIKEYRNFNIASMNRIAKALNVDCRYLLEGTPKKEYKEVKFNLSNVAEYTYKKRLNTDYSTRVILSKIRNGKQKKLYISTYHRLNEITKGKLFEILTGEN